MDSFTRILNPGERRHYRNVSAPTFVKVVWDGSRLSLTGVEGPKRNGDAHGSSGQIEPVKVDTFAPGWDPVMLASLNGVWKRWHLNDMRAGSPRQEAWLRENQVSYEYPMSHYEAATEALTAAGLNPAPDILTDDHKPYMYGHAWLREDVPADVLEWLASLPESTVKPWWV